MRGGDWGGGGERHSKADPLEAASAVGRVDVPDIDL